MNAADLKNKLFNLYEEQENFLKEKYDRSLSFQDGLFDRFDRAKKLGFDEGSSIYNSALVFGDVKIGIKTWIGPYVILDGSGGNIKIGDYCSISAGVHIYTHDSVMWALSGGKLGFHKANVLIGNCAHIGAQTIIKAGITIGSYCLIGANTFVNQSVEDYSILAGSPGKIIGKVVLQEEKITLEYFKK
ncbi:MAG: transferase family protein [uncultured bacterium]|nr:MAG: transferase family protein [uncultured bacterium]